MVSAIGLNAQEHVERVDTTVIKPKPNPVINTPVLFSSGTYKQVMVKWEELERSMARSHGGPYRLEPVPRMRFNNYGDHLVP